MWDTERTGGHMPTGQRDSTGGEHSPRFSPKYKGWVPDMAKTDNAIADQKTGEIIKGNSVISRDSLDTALTFAEAVSEAEAYGLSPEEYTVVTNIYEPLGKNKDALLAKPFFVRSVRFSADKITGNPFVILHVVSHDGNRYLVTDGSSGIYKQMDALVTRRITEGHKTPYNFYMIANGLRKSEFGINANGETVALGAADMKERAATYYLD